MKISIVVPYRDIGQSDRNRAARWFFKRLEVLFPGAEVIKSDAGERLFSRGKSINQGVEKATGDYIIITDSDYLISKELAKDLINDKPWTVCVDHKSYYFLDEVITNKILRMDERTFEVKEFNFVGHKVQSNYTLYGGILAMPKKNFVKFDESFVAYGFEDVAEFFCLKAKNGEEYRTPYRLYHLFHERPGSSIYMKKSYDNQAYYNMTWKPIENNKQAILDLMKAKGMI